MTDRPGVKATFSFVQAEAIAAKKPLLMESA